MKALRTACAAVAVISPLWAAAATVEIELRPMVSVSASEVSLGDVAYLRSDDLEALKQFMALPLGRAPRSGTSTALTREALARWVNARLRPAGTRVNWHGAPEVAVQSLAHEISGFLVEQTARASLAGWLKQRTSRFTIEPMVQPRDLQVPAGQAELRVRPLPAEEVVTARQRVWVDIHAGGEFIRAVAVDFKVAAYGAAWVAPRGVPAGGLMAVQSLERQEVSITAPGFKPLPLAETPEQMRTRRAIPPGGMVVARDVEGVPAVSRGQQVTLLAGDGGLALEMRGEALQDGHVGQAVKVRAVGSAAPVLAQVEAAGRVRVQP